MNKLLSLDCDGTIREPLSNAQFIQHPEDQKIILGADKAIENYYNKRWTIIGITNQGGVAAGYKSLEDAIEEQKYTLQLFPHIKFILFCPDFEGEFCYKVERSGINVYKRSDYLESHQYQSFRKPGNGMLMLARDLLPQYPKDSWYVGDRQEDIEAADSANFNYLDAQLWRNRFLPGMHEFKNLSLKQIAFLEF